MSERRGPCGGAVLSSIVVPAGLIALLLACPSIRAACTPMCAEGPPPSPTFYWQSDCTGRYAWGYSVYAGTPPEFQVTSLEYPCLGKISSQGTEAVTFFVKLVPGLPLWTPQGPLIPGTETSLPRNWTAEEVVSTFGLSVAVNDMDVVGAPDGSNVGGFWSTGVVEVCADQFGSPCPLCCETRFIVAPADESCLDQFPEMLYPSVEFCDINWKIQSWARTPWTSPYWHPGEIVLTAQLSDHPPVPGVPGPSPGLVQNCADESTTLLIRLVVDFDCDVDGWPDSFECAQGQCQNCNASYGQLCKEVTQCVDADTDHVLDSCDNCPGLSNPAQINIDGDSKGDACDACPLDPMKTETGVCGCGIPDSDSDHDGTPDCHDGCPDDSGKTDPGPCGCGTAEIDSDADSTPDCNDGCPQDTAKTSPGWCGCGVPETDSDQDGTPDCADECSADPDKTSPGACGCGNSERDSDGDGVPDCVESCDADTDQDGVCDELDNCPNVPNPLQTNSDGDYLGDACEDGSAITFLIALSGDNHAGSSVPLPFDPGVTADNQVYSAGTVITWEVRLLASGTQNAPGTVMHRLRPIGASLVLCDLELRMNTAEGAVVALGPGGPTMAGWFSTVNDGLAGRPLARCALCRSFDYDGNSSRLSTLSDLAPSGGPGWEIVQFPTLLNEPPGSTTPAGVLGGVGAAYRRFTSGTQRHGVGLNEFVSPCSSKQGPSSVFEGQLNTAGLESGIYVLKVTPVAGNALVDPGHCVSGSPGPMAVPANTLFGDTIAFQIVSNP